MKKNHYILFIVLLFLDVVFFKSYAQLTDENTQIITTYFQSINNVSTNRQTNNLNLDIQPNYDYVILEQVGNNNAVEVNSNPNNSQTVSQIGNDNHYQFLNYYNKTPTDFKIHQQGKSNSLQIYGSNSIVKNLSVLQSGNFKTVIIKNY